MIEYEVQFFNEKTGELEATTKVYYRALNYAEKVDEIVDLAWRAVKEDGSLSSSDISDYKFNVFKKS